MLRTLFCILVIGIMTSCGTDTPASQTDVAQLEKRHKDLSMQIDSMEVKKVKLRRQLSEADMQLSSKYERLEQSPVNGSDTISPTNQYVITLKLSQRSLASLSISTHVKNRMNDMSFEMPVSRRFYNSVNLGDDLVNHLQKGSLFMNGVVSKWNIKVADKRIIH